MSCVKGGFPSIRHNEIRDTTANWLTEMCNDVCVELDLQPLTGELMENAMVIVENRARLDIATNGFWGGSYERCYFDVRVMDPHVPSNNYINTKACNRKHERAKRGHMSSV